MLAEQQLFITQLGIQAEHIGLQNLELKFLINALVAQAIEAQKVKDLRVLA